MKGQERAITGHLYSGYSSGYRHERGLRQHRKRSASHSRTRRVRARFMSEAMSVDGGPASKRAKHEAHMIPGVDGKRIFGFPNSIITKIRYCDIVPITSTTGTRGLNVFAANGIYDCDITGTGHQPLYRDTYAGIYDNYVVIGSKITATFMPRTSGQCIVCGVVGDNDSTVSTTVTTLLEQNNSISHGMSSPGGPIVTLSQTYEPLEQIGVDAKDDGEALAPVSANPDDLFTFTTWAVAADLGTTVVVDVKVEIEYTVKFSQLSSPVQN